MIERTDSFVTSKHGVHTQNNRLRKLGSADYDGDGLSNNTEWFVTGTDVRSADTDGDGVSDNVEITKGTDPLNSKNYPGDGDLNQDGLIDAGDLLLETQIVLGLRVPTAAQLTHGDMNQDGLITTPDLLKLQRKALGIIALNTLRAMLGYEPMLAMMNSAEQHMQTATNKIETTTRHLLASIIPQANATPATGKLYYVHTDQLGTPQALTDETGAVVWRATYDPFGKATVFFGSSVEMNVRMPGQYADAETGLHYNYFRDYDPGTGRYLESDPIGVRGGLDPYTYGYNRPLKYVDPFGLKPVPCPEGSPAGATCDDGQDNQNVPPTCAGNGDCAAGLPYSRGDMRPQDQVDYESCQLGCTLSALPCRGIAKAFKPVGYGCTVGEKICMRKCKQKTKQCDKK